MAAVILKRSKCIILAANGQSVDLLSCQPENPGKTDEFTQISITEKIEC